MQYTEKLKKSSFICYILYIYSMWEWITKELEPASGKGYLNYTEAENEKCQKIKAYQLNQKKKAPTRFVNQINKGGEKRIAKA